MAIGILQVCLFSDARAQAVESIDGLIAREMQVARHLQVETQGYLEPADYTVKAGSLIQSGARTQRYEGGIATIIDSRIDISLWSTYIHHEYAHACQIAMGGPSKSVFMDEASASLQEVLAFGQKGSWQSAVEEFQQHPEIPPFMDVSELSGRLKSNSKFEYGGSLFLRFLDEKFGEGDGKYLRQLWTKASEKLPKVDNVDWVKMLEEASGQKFADLILEFANWRLDFPPQKTLAIAAFAEHSIFLTPFDWPLPMGCVSLKIPSPLYSEKLTMHVESQGPRGVSWRKLRSPSGAIESGSFKLSSLESDMNWNLEEDQILHISICNLDEKSFFERKLQGQPLKIAILNKSNSPRIPDQKKVENTETQSPVAPSCSATLAQHESLMWILLFGMAFVFKTRIKILKEAPNERN